MAPKTTHTLYSSKNSHKIRQWNKIIYLHIHFSCSYSCTSLGIHLYFYYLCTYFFSFSIQILNCHLKTNLDHLDHSTVLQMPAFTALYTPSISLSLPTSAHPPCLAASPRQDFYIKSFPVVLYIITILSTRISHSSSPPCTHLPSVSGYTCFCTSLIPHSAKPSHTISQMLRCQ